MRVSDKRDKLVATTDCLSGFRGTEVAYSRCRKLIRITPVASFPEASMTSHASEQRSMPQ